MNDTPDSPSDEAAHSRFPPAELERRFAAYALDRLIAWAVAAGIGYGAWRLLAPDDPWVAAATGFGALCLLGLVAAVLLGTTALSPGMALTGLRVVRVTDGTPIGVGPALGRTVVLGIGGLPTLGLGVATLAWTAAMDPSGRRRGRHDAIGDAMVVDVRPRPVVEVVEDERPQQIVNLTAMRLLPSSSGSHDASRASSAPSQPAAAPPASTAPAPSPAPAPAPAPAAAPPPIPQPSGPDPAPVASAAPTAATPVPAVPATPARPAAATPVASAATRRRDLVPQARWRVTFDTGESFVVEGLAVIGRRPEPRDGEPVRHVVPLRSEDMSLSKTHAQFQVVPDGALVVMDRGSTNGSHVLRGGASKTLSAGRPATLLDGDQVRFGDRTMQVVREA